MPRPACFDRFAKPFSCWVLGLVVVTGAKTSAAEAKPTSALFEQHCQKCHSGEKPKGKFDITKLTPDFADKKMRERWQVVLEQLSSGDMPPEGKPRPSSSEVKSVTQWIDEHIIAAERAHQKEEGRVVMRRLNRAEYANTVRDLLGVEVDLADLLPPDTGTNGFDNNAELLHTSSYLMRSYLDAAERVLNEAIANHGEPWQVKKRFDLKEERSLKKDSVYKHLDDGVAIFAVWESANIRVTMWNFRSPFRGKYRFRISGYGYQSEGKPVNFHVNTGTLKEVTEERLIDYFAVPADKPTVIEFTEQLEPENRLRIVADGLPALPPQVEKVGAENYKGPGLVIQYVDVEGPLMESWPPPSHKAIFGDLKIERMPKENDKEWREVVSSQPLADAERILREFARNAFRRPVTDADIKPFLARVKARLDNKATFEQAVRVGLKSILVSPSFLFLRESGLSFSSNSDGKLGLKPKPLLDDFAFASRLSYFLWSSMPDETLFKLAAEHKLRDPDVLHAQVERLLNDPKSKSFTENFTGQWLGLRAIDDTLPDRILYPEYDNMLKVAMLKETKLFFEEVLKQDLPVTNFVSSDFTFLNDRLAKHYKIPGIDGVDMRKVTLPPGTHRGGLLTMGSTLKVTANGTTTSPIIRGAWVLDRILGTPPPKPPADVEAIEPDIRGATTIREQLAKHRKVESCNNCHRKIDPPGFALESFDVIGGWRENYRALTNGGEKDASGRRVKQGPAVDPGATMDDGRRFSNIDELKTLLVENKDQLARSLAEKLMTYATGAEPTKLDQPHLDAIVANVRARNHGFRSLIHEVVKSPVFQTK